MFRREARPKGHKDNDTQADDVPLRVLDQLRSGVRAGFTITPALWLNVWLICRGIQAIGGSDVQLPATTPLSSQYHQSLIQNTTQHVFDDFRDPRRAAPSFTKDDIYLELKEFRDLLLAYSPGLSTWFETQWRDDLVNLDSSLDETRKTKQAQFHNGSLTLYDSFFELSDGEKLSVVAHEYIHAQETIFSNIADRASPQVIAGYVLDNLASIGAFGCNTLSAIAQKHAPPMSAEDYKKLQDWQKEHLATLLHMNSAQPAGPYKTIQHGFTTTSYTAPSTAIPKPPEVEKPTMKKIADFFENTSTHFTKLSQHGGLAHSLLVARDPSEHRALEAEQTVARDLSFDSLYGAQGHIAEHDPVEPPLPGQELFAATGLGLLAASIRKQHSRSKEKFTQSNSEQGS